MINSILADIAESLGLQKNEQGISGKSSGVLLAISSGENAAYHFNVYVGEKSKAEIKKLESTILNPKPKGFRWFKYNSYTHCIEIFLQFGLLRKQQTVKEAVLSLLKKITENCSPAPDGDFEVVGSAPMLLAEKTYLEAKRNRYYLNLKQRIGNAAIGLFVILMLAVLLAFLPQERTQRLQMLLSQFGAFVPVVFFLIKRKPGQILAWLETLYTICISIFSMVVVNYAVAFASIPSIYSRDLELANLVLFGTHGQLGLRLFVPIILSCLFIFLIFLGSVKKNPKKDVYAILSAQKNIKKWNFALGLYTAVGIGLLFFSIFLNIPADRSENIVEVLPFILIGAGVHVGLGVILLFFLYLDSEYRSSIGVIYGGHRKLHMGALVLLAPIFYSLSVMVISQYVNSKMDSSVPIKKVGILSAHSKAIARCCFSVLDKDTLKETSVRICGCNGTSVEGGEEVSYFYKPGYFNVGITFGEKIERPTDWEQLLVKKPDVSLIRISDVEPILNNPEQAKMISETLSPHWLQKCEAGEGAFCRFLAYIAEFNKNKEKAVTYYSSGCEKGDYSSCLGWRLFEPESNKALELHESLAKEACVAKSDTSACYQYWGYWKDNGNRDRQANLRDVTERICRIGDVNACEQLVWEMHRKN